jgi:Asp-tRNA(Asn)/Glu-tRNA(Gln) amidotransferase A subunit family amidase
MSVCARNLDHLGPISSSVPLAAQALVHIQNPGWPDTSVDPTFTPELKVAVLTGEFLEHCDPDAVAAFEEGVRLIEKLCYSVTEVDLGIDLAAADEHANVLGRDLFDVYRDQIAGASNGTLGPEFQYWVDLYATASDDDYAAALAEQRRVMAVVAEKQKSVDVLLCPTLRGGASTRAAVVDEARERRTGNVALFNLTGQPSLTVPFGTAANGLPLGMLLTGRSGEDEIVLTLGTAFEAAQR